jgi:exopolysaccharide biosynthesis polyprenyl glycosylphosphotransferase
VFEEVLSESSRALSDLVVPREIAESRPRLLEGATSIYRRLAVGLVVGDALAVLAAVLISRVLMRSGPTPPEVWALLAVLAPLATVAVFAGYRLHRLNRLSPNEEFRRVIGAVSVTVVLLGVASNVASGVLLGDAERVPLTVGWLGVAWLTALLLVMVERKAWHRVLHHLRRSGRLAMRTLVIGANDEGVDLSRSLGVGSIGFDVVGMVSVNGERISVSPGPGDPPVLGALGDLADLVRSRRIECAFMASSAMRPESMTRALAAMRRLNVEVRVSANMPEILASRLSVQTVGKTLALSVQTASLSGSQAFIKRLFDVLIATLAIVVTSPIWLVSAAAIRFTSEGPVLFRQQRIGRQGRAFTMLKFRTMVVGADRMVESVAERSADQGPLFKLDDDPRLTRVGRVLRMFSVDELPQLINVIRGEMSLVGPRPMPARFGQDSYEQWHLHRLEVLPGMTGLWQVSGRSDLTFDECVRLDLFYIENWSVAYDLFILLKTIPAVLKGRGAY